MKGVSTSLLALVVVSLLAPACGSEVQQQESASGGGSGGDPSSGTGNTGGSTTSGTTGQGGAGAATTTSGTAGAGGTKECAGLFESQCLAAYPACAPVYHDACCSNCVPGPCADCQNFEFYECGNTDTVCTTGSCGVTPEWACAGKTADCPPLDPGGSEYECESTPGCVIVHCSPDVNCASKECHAVTAGSCTTSCDSIPPSCPANSTAESDGFCYTGYCIPANVCGVF